MASKADLSIGTVIFRDLSDDVVDALGDAVGIWLEDSASELEAKTKDLSRVDTGHTKRSYAHAVDPQAKVAIVGSPLENAIWEEFGTGEYALYGNGRKGGWLYENRDGETVFTRGKFPNRPLYRAFEDRLPLIRKRLELLVSQLDGGE